MLLCLLASVLSAAGFAAERTTAPLPILVVRNVTLVDPVTPPRSGWTVRIVDGLIDGLGPTDDGKALDELLSSAATDAQAN